MKRIILISLLFVLIFSQTVMGEEASKEPTPIRTAVIPFKNATGDLSLDWISIGLQDAMTVDLWYLKGFETLSLLSLPSIDDLSKMGQEELIENARDELSLDQVWIGTFAGNPDEIVVEITVLDVATGKTLTQYKFKGGLSELLKQASVAVLEISQKLGVSFSEDEKSRVLSKKTDSVEAWRLNAEGFKYQKLYSDEEDEKKRMEIAKNWEKALTASVDIDPRYTEAWNNLGWMYVSKEDWEKAEQVFQKALSIKTFLIDAIMGLGYSYDRTFNDKEALVQFRKGVDLNPSLVQHQLYLFRKLRENGDREFINIASRLFENPSSAVRVSVIKAIVYFFPPRSAVTYVEVGTETWAIEDKPMVTILIKALKDSDGEVRNLAALGLSISSGVRDSDIPALIEALQDSDKRVRYWVANALGKIKNETALTALIEALNDSDKTVRLVVASALCELGDKSGIKLILEAIKDSDVAVRRQAAMTLGEIGDKIALPVLIEALKDPDNEVRRLTVEALSIGDKTAIPFLIEALKDSDTEVRMQAAMTLGEIGDKATVPVLIETLKDSDVAVRRQAAWVLGRMGDKAAVPVLIEGLKDSDKNARWGVAWVLGETGDKSAVPALIEALKDTDEDVRYAAAKALGEIGDKSAVPALIEALKDSDKDVRDCVVRAISSLCDKTEILALFENSDEKVRILSAEILGKLGDKTGVMFLVEILKNSVKDDMREKAAEVLGQIKSETAIPALIEALKDSDAEVRRQAARALSEIGGKTALSALIEALKDSDNEVRRLTVEALSIGDKTAIPFLIEALKDSDTKVRRQAARALSEIGGKTALSALIEALKDSDAVVRTVAISSLGDIGGRAVVTNLIDALKDPEEVVRITAIKTLANIGEYEYLYNSYLNSPARNFFFNIMRGQYYFYAEGINKLTLSQKPFLQSSGFYLLSLKSREEGKYQDQLEYAIKALEPIDPKNDTALAILSLWLKAQAELKLDKPQEALGTIKKAEELLDYLSRKERDDYGELFEEYTLYMKGEVNAAIGDSKSAIKAYEDSLEGLERKKGDYQWKESAEKLEVMTLTSLGSIQIKQGKENLEKAVEGGRNYQASDSVEMENEEKRYLELSRQKIAEGNYEEAQKLIEELNLRRADYANRRMKLKLSDEEKQRHVDEYNRKKQEIESINRQIEEKAKKREDKTDEERSPQKTEDIHRLEAEKKNKQRELQVYLTNLKKTHPDIAALLGAKPIELTTIQEQLPVDVAILQYLMLTDKLVVFVIKKDGIEIVETQVKRNELEGKVKTLRSDIFARSYGEKSREIKPLSIELNDILIKPIEDAGKLKGIKTLGIAPNGFLHQLPFSALISRNENGEYLYLIDCYSTFYINSTSILYVAMDRTKQKMKDKSSLLAFSNPDGSLEYADIEVNSISQLFDRKHIYSQKEAKKELVQTMPLDTSILHLSTHGKFNPIDSTKSYLVMADNNLTVEDIWGLPLKGITLTTLSACETGIGEVLSGDDVVSLENAFIYAGSPAVISTLWKVADKSTAELMGLFYQNLQKGMTKAEALTDAQRQIREKYPHPFFWSAFTLRGDWR